MAELNLPLGTASVILRVLVRDATTLARKTGLTSATAGLVIGTVCDVEAASTKYRASSGEIDSVTVLGTYEPPVANHCRFRELDPTNHPGIYEVHLNNLRYNVSGARTLRVTVSGASADGEAVVQFAPVPADVRKVLGGDPTSPDDDVAFLRKVFAGDWVIDTTTTPWNSVVYEAGTSTELMRKVLRDVSGIGITSTNVVICSRKDA